LIQDSRAVDELKHARTDLVVANHILFSTGVVDGFGHVSVRHPLRPDRLLIARSVAPALVKLDDILELDLTGATVSHDDRGSYLERFIHTEVYALRPDVGAVVHSHSPSVVPFGVVGDSLLRPLYHMASFLGAGAPVFEIRDVAGDATDLLIRNRELGAALARSLGKADVVLMRGHGCTVVGPDLRTAVFQTVYTEVNAKMQVHAQALGPPTFLSVGEAAATNATNASQVGRAWALWKAQAEPLCAALQAEAAGD